ncbi:MAG: threonine synthase, partial [Nanoarchaeota archaeon]
ACASTGNTSASMSAYASIAGMVAIIFIPKEDVTIGKLSQALAYGAKTLRINGNFDFAMKIVQRACKKFNMYLLNSINPFRIEGQKTIAFEALQQLKWQVPNWFVLPGGNLGNCSAIGKGLRELHELGLINKLPRIAVIQAKGSNPFYLSYKENFKKFLRIKNPKTIASAIRIGNPVSWKKAKEVIEFTNGVVEDVTDQEIIDAKLIIDRAGIGCEPASASTVAGIKKLVKKGMIKSSETIVAILTGNILKDIDIIINYNEGKLDGIITKSPNLPKMVNSLDEVERALV